MKKILIIGLLIGTLVSCDDLSELNQDVKNPQEVPAGALFANATKNFFDFMTEQNVNINNFRLWSQQWAQTTYADESNYNLIERNVNGRTWDLLYVDVIRDLQAAKQIVSENQNLSDEAIAEQIATFEVLEIFAWHILVDIFGDIPYTEALTSDPTPAYDDDQAIYTDLYARLDAAIATLSAGGDSGIGGYDLLYGGSNEDWLRTANSLKLRMAWRLVLVNESLAITKAQEAVNSGIYKSYEEQFMLPYEDATPNTNPLWVTLVQSGRSDYVATSTIVDPMQELDDPRIDDYFQDTYGAPAEYVGGAYGDNNLYSAFSHAGALQEDPTWPGIVLSYWELMFILADLEERGASFSQISTYTTEVDLLGDEVQVTMDEPAEFYNEGITASIIYWGNDKEEADDYLAQPEVDYDQAGAEWEQYIAYQKWVALYDQGFEAWSTYRLYDYPLLPIAVQAGIPTPKRYIYPVGEYSLNEENVRTAGDAMGADALESPVFWDVD